MRVYISWCSLARCLVNCVETLDICFDRLILLGRVKTEAHANENGQRAEHEDEAPHKTALDRLVLCDKPDATLELFIWELTRRIYAVCP